MKYRKGKTKIIKNKECFIKPQYRFQITNKKISFDLRKHGLCENKSLKIRFPKISKKFINDFIRGYFDGDGCLHINKKRGNNAISIVSNHLFCEDLKEIIKKHVKILCYVRKKTKTVSSVSITGNIQIKKF